MSSSAGSSRLFDESTLRKLEQLSLVAENVRAGMMKGERRSRKRGSSVEFADYRDYAPGDDLRRLDWNVYARLERPFIKLLEEEEDLAVHLLLDCSGSMDWPSDGDPLNKFQYARRLVAALAVIALATGDQVRLAVLGADRPQSWGPFRGRGNNVHVMKLLETVQAGGVTDLNRALRRYSLRALRPGLAIIVSDLLSPTGFLEGLSSMQVRGYEVGLIQLLSPDEMQPPLAGDLKLVDVETGGEAEVTLDNVTIDLYKRRLHAWQQETAAYCAGRGLHYIPVVTDLPWQTLVMQTLRVQGLVR